MKPYNMCVYIYHYCSTHILIPFKKIKSNIIMKIPKKQVDWKHSDVLFKTLNMVLNHIYYACIDHKTSHFTLF